jgi:hypothetical protein
MLGALSPKQAEAKNRVEKYYVVKAPMEAKAEKLEAYVEPSKLTFDAGFKGKAGNLNPTHVRHKAFHTKTKAQ